MIAAAGAAPDPPARSAQPELTPEEQYRALRGAVGAVPVGRDVLGLTGPDTLDYLQGQLSQDVAALAVGVPADALLLSPQGKLDALVRVTRLGDEAVAVDVDEGFGTAVLERLERFRLRVKVVIEPLPWRCVALRGPGAAASAGGGTGTPPSPGAGEEGRPWVLPFSWNGVQGVDLLGAAPVVPPGVPWCSPGAWQSVRVEAGIPVMGAELDDRTIAAEAELLDRAVSFTKGCYTGQELVARLDARGNRVARHLRGLVADEPPPAPGPDGLAPGSEITVQGKAVGTVTSAAWSPALGRPVALAYVHRSVEPPAAVEVRGPGGALRAVVRALPLVDGD